MPLTFLPGATPRTMPDTIERDGLTYTRREVAAYRVAEGDLVDFHDCTGRPGTIAPYAVGAVKDVERYAPGSGRRYVPEHSRIELHLHDWRGDVRWLPTAPLKYAPRDRVTVWRNAQVWRKTRSYTYRAVSRFAPAGSWRWHCGQCDTDTTGPHGGIGWYDTRESAQAGLREHNAEWHVA